MAYMNKDRIIDRLMATQFADDDPKYYDRTVSWLKSKPVEELRVMLDEWETYYQK